MSDKKMVLDIAVDIIKDVQYQLALDTVLSNKTHHERSDLMRSLARQLEDVLKLIDGHDCYSTDDDSKPF